jgi:hypothetical protein
VTTPGAARVAVVSAGPIVRLGVDGRGRGGGKASARAAPPVGDGVEDAFDLAGEVALELVLPDAEDLPALAA